jgi:hypothetical protein
MSFFRRNRHDPNERPFVSWAPTAQPDSAAQTEAAVTTTGAQTPGDASVALATMPDRPAPHERGPRS